MKIELKDSSLYINSVPLTLKETAVSFYLEALDTGYRSISLDFGVTILVFDQIGIRAWMKGNIVYELEIQLLQNIDTDLKSPSALYNGAISLWGKPLSPPYLVEEIVSHNELNVARDDDSFRFGLHILKSVPDRQPRYSLWCDDAFLRVCSIRFN
ncbi:hypothetical protein [Taibaiella koreensis]|uniref:hypothetical protein n=1 Tax=Taibaiella koreensis TaxID=1268548 RepID=UPI000E59B7F9|nr:hypothetical protein [Taibaiella koreensis]